jgi:hypothetical protein
MIIKGPPSLLLNRVTPNNNVLTGNKNSLIVSRNNALNFVKGNNTTSFELVRSKLRFLIIVQVNNKEFKFAADSEFIDVSIPNNNDSNLHHSFNHKYYATFDVHGKYDKCISVKVPTIEYTSEDIAHVLFDQNVYPWDDAKYKKRLLRLILLTLLMKFLNQLTAVEKTFTGINDIIIETMNRTKNDITQFITAVESLGRQNAVVRNVTIRQPTDPIKIFLDRVETVAGKDKVEYQQFIQSTLSYLRFIANIINANQNWQNVDYTNKQIGMFLTIDKIGQLPLTQLGGHMLKKYMPKRRKQFQMK